MFCHHLLCFIAHLFPLAVSVRINVKDIDDTKPDFIDPLSWNFQINEFDQRSSSIDEFKPVNLTQKIYVKDDDETSKTFKFDLQVLGQTPSDLVEIVQDGDVAILRVKSVIDREAQEIVDINGILHYKVKVSDAANNTNELPVRPYLSSKLFQKIDSF